MEGSPKKHNPISHPSAFAVLLATQSDVAAAIVIRSMTLEAACLLAETSPAARALYHKHLIFKKKNLNMSLQVCCARGYVECVKEILAYKKLNPNLGVYYPLRIACEADRLDVAKLLLADARVTKITTHCFRDAICNTNYKLARLLLADARTKIPYQLVVGSNEPKIRIVLDDPELAEMLRTKFIPTTEKVLRSKCVDVGLVAEDIERVVNFYFR